MTPDNEHWKLFDGTTAPPWEVCTNKAGNCTIRQVGSSGYLSPWIASERDAALIVAAVNALPELLAENARLREAFSGPAAWLDRWAQHVGNCKGGHVCTCGLTLARTEARTALKETGHE